MKVFPPVKNKQLSLCASAEELSRQTGGDHRSSALVQGSPARPLREGAQPADFSPAWTVGGPSRQQLIRQKSAQA